MDWRKFAWLMLGTAGWLVATAVGLAFYSMRRLARRLVRWVELEIAARTLAQGELLKAEAAAINNKRVHRGLLEYYGRMYPPGLEMLRGDGVWVEPQDITPEMVAELETARALEAALLEAQEAQRKLPPSEDNILRLR